MTTYLHYTPEEFSQDDRFRHWVLTSDEETGQFWQNFITIYPDKKSDVIRARALLLAMHSLGAEPSLEQGQRMKEAIFDQIEQDEQTNVSVFKTVYTNVSRYWISIAASVALVGMVWWYTSIRESKLLPPTYERQVAQVSEPLIEKVNPTRNTQRIQLPDGSVVQLSPNAKLSYEKAFTGRQRKVYLSGQGYFEVVKDDSKPFLVFANNIVTQVVGTRFTVNSSQSTIGISVTVKSGKVKVFTLEQYQKPETQKAEQTVVLTANQQATYDPAQAMLTKSIIARPEVIRKPAKFPDFNFNSAAIRDVFATLEQSYGVTILYNQQTVENCNLTAQLGDEPLFKKLDIICRTIDATYEVWGAKIVVTGKGCAAN
ncbi:FecR family protein [Spirosoma gilvum]